MSNILKRVYLIHYHIPIISNPIHLCHSVDPALENPWRFCGCACTSAHLHQDQAFDQTKNTPLTPTAHPPLSGRATVACTAPHPLPLVFCVLEGRTKEGHAYIGRSCPSMHMQQPSPPLCPGAPHPNLSITGPSLSFACNPPCISSTLP